MDLRQNQFCDALFGSSGIAVSVTNYFENNSRPKAVIGPFGEQVGVCVTNDLQAILQRQKRRNLSTF